MGSATAWYPSYLASRLKADDVVGRLSKSCRTSPKSIAQYESRRSTEVTRDVDKALRLAQTGSMPKFFRRRTLLPIGALRGTRNKLWGTRRLHFGRYLSQQAKGEDHACHVLVAHQGQGEFIYGMATESLRKCVQSCLKLIHESAATGIEWLRILVQQWQWYEEKIVSLPRLL